MTGLVLLFLKILTICVSQLFLLLNRVRQTMRSNLLLVAFVDPEKPELDYVLIGNKNLPPDIRILAWCPVPLDFSPRRDCISRSYKYFFPVGDLNIEDMRVAASKLIGPHDFRNFCTPQITSGVFNHERIIFDIDLSEEDGAKAQVLIDGMFCSSFITRCIQSSDVLSACFCVLHVIVPFSMQESTATLLP